MINKCNNFIGLATKAGKVVTGFDLCENAVKKGLAKLVIVSVEASDLTKKSFADSCKFRNVAYRIYGSKVELGKFTGKYERTVVAIVDEGFANKILELIDEMVMNLTGEVK